MDKNKGDILTRIYLVYLFSVIFALVIVYKVIVIQFVQGNEWKEVARNTTMKYMDIEAVRGDILSDEGKLLATSIPVYEIRMDLQVVDKDLFNNKIDSLSFHLSRLFDDRSKNEYKSGFIQARKNQERYYLVKRNVSYIQLNQLKRFPIFNKGRFRGGLIIVERNRREMPFKSLANRTIGYERGGAYVGLEGAYRDYLEGVQGKRLMQRISGGDWMPVSDENEIKSQNGKDVLTTINVYMQDIVESALRQQLKKTDASHGTAVVMEVETGKIKAISNLALGADKNYHETFNFAVGEAAEPGSTFKLVSMIAALEDNHVKPDDFIETGKGTIRFADRIMRDAHPHGYGTLSVKEAFALSSNVAISKIIYDSYNKNPQQFLDRMQEMGITEPHGIKIKGEGQPYFPDPATEEWSGVTLPWISIGYGMLITPIQILALYNAVANDGTMMKPMFVEEIRQTGRTIKKFQPTVFREQICSESTLKAVQKMLVDVVENGTAKNIYTPVYQIAGKTGTAQVANGKGYKSSSGVVYRASFAGYFPANDPRYSMIVVVHDPSGSSYSGSQVAAPVFRKVSDRIFATRLNIPQPFDNDKIFAALPRLTKANKEDIYDIYNFFDTRLIDENDKSQWLQPEIINADTVLLNVGILTDNAVPDVVGMGLKDAMYLLENAGLRVRFTGRGVVRRQSIEPGKKIYNGNVIYLELSKS